MIQDGYKISTVDLPFTGLDDDAAFLSNILERADDEIVLLGHSYGGMVISKAAEGRENISHLVYLCAILLEEGKSMGGSPGSSQESKIKIEVDENLSSTVRGDAVIPAFYGDVDLQLAQDSLDRLRPFPIHSVNIGIGEAWRDHPTTYVVCKDDAAIPPDVQRRMSGLADRVLEWDCGHSPFLSNPELVCGLLQELAG